MRGGRVVGFGVLVVLLGACGQSDASRAREAYESIDFGTDVVVLDQADGPYGAEWDLAVDGDLSGLEVPGSALLSPANWSCSSLSGRPELQASASCSTHVVASVQAPGGCKVVVVDWTDEVVIDGRSLGRARVSALCVELGGP